MNLTLSTPRLALRIWQSHLIMIVIGFIVFATNRFTETNPLITAFATVFLLFIFYVLCYNETNRCGKNDVNQGRDGGIWKGLIAGVIASVPGVVLLVISCFFTMPQAWYRLYMIVYEGLLSFTGETWMMKLLILLPMPAVSMIGYCTGRKGWSIIDKLQDGMNKMVYEKRK